MDFNCFSPSKRFHFLKKLAMIAPRKPKYKLLFKGLDVIGQEPVTHPTNFQ
jgi:hypothetical protein